MSYWLQPLHSFPLAQHVLRNFEELVCRNGTEMMAGGDWVDAENWGEGVGCKTPL